MGATLASLLLLVVIVSGIAFMFKSEAGKRLLVSVIVLLVAVLVLGPILACLINSLLGSATVARDHVPAPSGGRTVLFLFLLVLVLVAAIRFAVHRRKLRQLLGERPTSLKRRLDSEGA